MVRLSKTIDQEMSDQYSPEYYLETLKNIFGIDDCSFEYDETDKRISIECMKNDSVSYLALRLNEYNTIDRMYYSEYDMHDENEIVVPESLHDPNKYTEEELEKLEKESEKEFEEWDVVELIKFDVAPQIEITIKRIVEAAIHLVDPIHFHFFKGYSISAKGGLDINKVINIVKSFDMLIAIAEKYYELRKRLEQSE